MIDTHCILLYECFDLRRHLQPVIASSASRLAFLRESHNVADVQMALGRPPHSDLHPMRALFLIPAEDAPRLEGPFSQEFKSFVAQCLQKVLPTQNPTGRSHPTNVSALHQLLLLKTLEMLTSGAFPIGRACNASKGENGLPLCVLPRF